MRDRRVRALLVVGLVLVLFGLSRDATSGIYYDPQCADQSWWGWWFEGCWLMS